MKILSFLLMFLISVWFFIFLLYLVLVVFLLPPWKSDFKMAWQKKETTERRHIVGITTFLVWDYYQYLQYKNCNICQFPVCWIYLYIWTTNYIVAIWNDFAVVLYCTLNFAFTKNPCCGNSFIKLINKGKIRLVL